MRGTARVGELLAFDVALVRGEIPAQGEAARPTDAPRLFPMAGHGAEKDLFRLVGFDEAGRGALAGPIVVGCVEIPLSLLLDAERVLTLLDGVDDSKRLTPRARAEAYGRIAASTRWAAGCASAIEVDAVGIVEAAERATRRAYRRLGASCDVAVFDRGLSLGEAVSLDGCPARRAGQLGSSAPFPGCRTPLLARENEACIARGMPPGVAFTKGDTRSLHVAAASLVAKVTRDRLMVRLERVAPGYDLAKHKGYGTQAHFRAIAARGPSPLHRRTFLRRIEEAKSQSC